MLCWRIAIAMVSDMACNSQRFITLAATIACAVVMMSASVGHARELYRYRNDEGVTVVDWRVPAEYASKGYEVLNEEGLVIEVVPRALTDEERLNAVVAEKLTAEAQAERERLRERDESLLRRYSSVADIEAARARSLRDLQIRVSILKSNRRSLRQRVENSQARVAEAERTGTPLPARELEQIERLKAEILATERSITDRQAEVESVTARYQEDIERFQQLLDVVELRRNLEKPQDAKKPTSPH